MPAGYQYEAQAKMLVFNSVKAQNSTMTQDHPNVLLLKSLDLLNLADSSEMFAHDFVWNFSNPKFPAIQGDYPGLEGLQSFFNEIGTLTGGSFMTMPISATPMGDELIVEHLRDKTILQGKPIDVDAVVMWRIVDGRIAEAWVIPSSYTMAVSEAADEIHA